jgi:hypothetical protein
VHYPFPDQLALECLADGNGLSERRDAAVHILDGFAELTFRTQRHASTFTGLRYFVLLVRVPGTCSIRLVDWR